MKNWLCVIPLCLLIGLSGVGCGDDSSDADGDGTDDGDNLDGGEDANGNGNGNGGDFVACETLSTDVSRVATKVMLLEDKSYSMSENSKWELAIDAIDEMVSAYENDIRFGLDLFSRGTVTDTNSPEMCIVGDSVLRDVALGSGAEIMSELSGWVPSAATPLYLGMQNFIDSSYAPGFMEGGGSYLVIISDGKDTCGTDGVFDQSDGATPAELAALTSQLRNSGIRTIVIGFGRGAEPDELNAIAGAGGTSFTEYLQADDGEELRSVLSQIAEKVVVSCEFHVGTFTSSDVNYNQVAVTFDGKQIPRDNGCQSGIGWTWATEAHTAIEFCTQACNILEAGDVSEVKVELACSENDVISVE